MKVLTLGTFDVFHYGHLHFLQQIANYGEVVVAVNSDRFVTEYKGKPVLTEDERATPFRLLGMEVVINDGPGKETIKYVRPDVIAIGSDWARKDYLKQIDITQDELDELGISLLYVPYTQGISTTDIKGRISDRDN